MKFYIFIVIAVFVKFSYAQQAYEFSGLKWGSNIEQSETQLRNSGYSTTKKGSMFCAQINTCNSIDFQGFGINGNASFANNRLHSISIYSSSSRDENWKRYDKLVEKYGKPLPISFPPGTSDLAKGLAYQNAKWESKTGDTIDFHNGFIQYNSKDSKNNESNKNLDSVKF